MRIKRGKVKAAKHKKILALAKGYRMSYSKLYRRAKEAVAHAGNYSFAHRKAKRSQLRTDSIQTISAALYGSKYSYSKFISSLKKNNVEVDRKNLAELAINHPEDFKVLVDSLK